MKENKVYKKDGELVVQFTFTKGSSMFEMEEQIQFLLDSVDESISELEKQSVRTQLLDAINNESKKDHSCSKNMD